MKIIIVDDHPIVRFGLEQTISAEEDIDIVGVAETCFQGVSIILEKRPDLAIVDLKMPNGGGLELIEKIKEKKIDCKFLILTSFIDDSDILKALELGVEGYVLKEILPSELIKAIRTIANGKKYYDPEVMTYFTYFMKAKKQNDLSMLTNRELEILKELASGSSNKEIAQKLFISENTVKKHISNILSKLGLQDRTQAALYAYSRGLINKD